MKSLYSAERRAARRLLIPTIAVIGLLLVSGQELCADAERKNLAGCELTARLQPLASQDPYSGPLSLGVFYERHQVLWKMYIGGQVEYWGFYPLWANFGESSMIVSDLKLGYDFLFRIERRFALAVSPYFSGGFYWRRFVFQDNSYSALRPVLGAGAAFDLYVGRHLILGVNLELTCLLDQRVRWAAGLGERLGARF